MNTPNIDRRRFLVTSGTASLSLAAASTKLVAAERDKQSYVRQSQPLPQPKIVFPTDALGPPQGKPLKIAAVTTAYFKYSHADDIITKFIEGYSIVGRNHQPHCKVVSMYLEQKTEKTDIGHAMAARYGVKMFNSPQQALTLGGDKLAVDAVLLIGEHGEYPYNEKGQHLYPRHRLFSNIVEVFRQSKKSVPVYNDKHFSYSWEKAKWMYEQSRELGFPLAAGSSVPVAWRRPALALKPGVPLDSALSVGFAGPESYGFHALELLQTFTEKRQGGETGVAAVEVLSGAVAWKAAREGRWRVDLLEAAIASAPSRHKGPIPHGVDELQKVDPEPLVYLIHYRDGFSAAVYMANRLVSEFCVAAAVKGVERPVGTWCELNKPQRDHFSFLCNHIEVMFRSGKSSYPVERTYLVTGTLEALMDSKLADGKRIETPHLTNISYTPVED